MLPKKICYAFNLSHDHTSPYFQGIMWFHRWDLFTISHQHAMFGDHRSWEKGVKFSVCRVNSRYQWVIWHYGWVSLIISQRRYFAFNLSRDLMWPRHQRVSCHYGCVYFIISHHPAMFGGHRRCAREDISFSFLVCHVRSGSKRVTLYYGWVSLVISDYHAKFGDHKTFGRGDT